MFKFRELTIDDFPLLLEWLSKEHIRQWWNDGDDTLEKVAQHYGKKDADVARFILTELEGGVEKPVGYFQYYLVSDGSIGIDQFIGDENRVNQGIGEKAIRMFVELILRRCKPTSIILDPSLDNKRAIRCYEKVGFRHYKTNEAYDGSLTYMMRLEIR
jgi:RimJ/RimL family protein N-acetyltransferase